jgi:winged helix DNA-binding protein
MLFGLKISDRRLLNQQLVRPRFTAPKQVVRWFGAVQAQDYPGGLWAVGQRLPSVTQGEVEDAVVSRAIVRTWPMRGTLHFVAAEDARWMLRLLTPRVIAGSAGRCRQLELDARALARSGRILGRALEGGRRLTRPQAYDALARGGVSPAGQRGIHVLGHLAQQGLLCFGPREGRQPAFVLFEEWIPRSRDLPRDAALATLAARYYTSHGPATLQDFAWWSGLLVKDAQAGIEEAGSQLAKETHGGRSYWVAAAAPEGKWRRPAAALLPPWDEYLVAYKDRDAALGHLPAGNEHRLTMVVGKSLIVIDGRVRGTWQRTLAPSKVTVTLDFWTPMSSSERRAITKAAERYGRFLGKPAEIRIVRTDGRTRP